MQPCLPFPHQVLVSLLVLQGSCLATLPPPLLRIVSPGSHFARLCSPSEHVRLCGCLIIYGVSAAPSASCVAVFLATVSSGHIADTQQTLGERAERLNKGVRTLGGNVRSDSHS